MGHNSHTMKSARQNASLSHSKLEWAEGKFSLCDQRVRSICADLRIGDAPGISLFDNGSDTTAITLLISPDVPFVVDHSTADSVARVFSEDCETHIVD